MTMKSEHQNRRIVGTVLFSRLLIFVVAIAGSVVVPYSIDVPKVNFRINIPVLGLFANWDTAYFFDMATKGISGYQWAFRPLYPLILWMLGLPLRGVGANEASLIAGMSWNVFALVLAVVYLYKFTELMYDQQVAYYTVILLSISPGGVFFTAPYPESTYLLLMVASFFYLEKNRTTVATFLGFLVALTRPEGFLIFVPFVSKALFLRGKERLKMLSSSLIILLSLPIFMFFSFLVKGDPFISFKIESAWSKTKLIDVIMDIYYNRSTYGLAVYFIPIIVLVIAIWAMVTYFFSIRLESRRLVVKPEEKLRNKQMPYFLFAILLLAFFVCLGEFKSFPRYASTLFPILWANSIWLEKNSEKAFALYSLYASLMALGTLLFTNWYLFI
jgi:hypothetical protein